MNKDSSSNPEPLFQGTLTMGPNPGMLQKLFSSREQAHFDLAIFLDRVELTVDSAAGVENGKILYKKATTTYPVTAQTWKHMDAAQKRIALSSFLEVTLALGNPEDEEAEANVFPLMFNWDKEQGPKVQEAFSKLRNEYLKTKFEAKNEQRKQAAK